MNLEEAVNNSLLQSHFSIASRSFFSFGNLLLLITPSQVIDSEFRKAKRVWWLMGRKVKEKKGWKSGFPPLPPHSVISTAAFLWAHLVEICQECSLTQENKDSWETGILSISEKWDKIRRIIWHLPCFLSSINELSLPLCSLTNSEKNNASLYWAASFWQTW